MFFKRVIKIDRMLNGYSATRCFDCENDEIEVSIGGSIVADLRVVVAIVTLKKLDIELQISGKNAERIEVLVKEKNPKGVYTQALKLLSQHIAKKPSAIAKLLDDTRKQGQKEGRNEIRKRLEGLMVCE